MPPAPPLPAPPGHLRLRAAAAALVAGGLLAGCGDDTGTFTDVRERPPTQPRAPEMSTKERLRSEPHGGRADGGAVPAATAWTWTAPPGWEPLPRAPMREAGFRVGGNPDAECTLATAGGTLVDNLNRWRRQVGLEPADAAWVASLPREPFLGGDGILVELAGTWKGMRGDRNDAGWKLLGLVAERPGTSVFVKMTGPASVVDAEKERFRAFARSVKPSMPEGHPDVGAPGAPEPAPSEEAPLRWHAPAGWVESPPRPMRVVTFVPQGASRTECYVSLLGGTAGGYYANVNRWRQQMGLAEVGKAEIDALPRIPSMGTAGVFVELSGRLDDPMRGVKEDDALLYGLVVEREDGTVFVKMTGPASEMRPQRAAFEAFCRSLEVRR